jgi:quinol monooxygenase YgiN
MAFTIVRDRAVKAQDFEPYEAHVAVEPMIHVIATICTVPGRRDDVLKSFRALVPQVRAEVGCIEYGTAIDLENAIDGQPAARPDVITVVEKWQDPAALRKHLAVPHMLQFRDTVKDLVAAVEIRVLAPDLS